MEDRAFEVDAGANDRRERSRVRTPDGSTFELWNPEANWPWERGNGIMFAVADAREAVAELRSRGITIGDPMDNPMCFMAIGEDSEGTNS